MKGGGGQKFQKSGYVVCAWPLSNLRVENGKKYNTKYYKVEWYQILIGT